MCIPSVFLEFLQSLVSAPGCLESVSITKEWGFRWICVLECCVLQVAGGLSGGRDKHSLAPVVLPLGMMHVAGWESSAVTAGSQRPGFVLVMVTVRIWFWLGCSFPLHPIPSKSLPYAVGLQPAHAFCDVLSLG